ncbi:helix-turn-helix domain-containing protein [Embleya sp. NBC_00896]|uniref:AraC-like ligand-binding domain-containing protein n=1 Tax=Embleya sp. NBC_00896 TaxID=2975961 RepID=UPI002F9180FD|nr:helix-turn-helix domain-containing protein [Embleya sp. NBC_00896]
MNGSRTRSAVGGAGRDTDVGVGDFDAWRSIVHDFFFAAELERPAGRGFAGRLRHHPLGPIDLARIEATPHNFRRTAADVAAHGADVYDVVLVLAGQGSAAQDGRDGELCGGRLVISDSTRPYRIDFDSPFHLAQLVLPRRLLGTEPERVAPLTGVPIDTSRGTAALLAGVLTQVTEPTGARAPGVDPHLADTVTALCRAVVAELIAERGDTWPETGSDPAAEARRRELRARMMAWIENHLDDPGLDPAMIARAHFVSTRYLHRLFQDQPVSVARFVRERRLERIRRDLADPALLGMPVSTLAAHWGIGDAARFSRVFRDQYGVSPSTYRAGRAGFGPPGT